MGLFDLFKKKEAPAPAPLPAAASVEPPGIMVQGEDGPIDFGRVRPDDPAAFGALLGEYHAAVNGADPGVGVAVARKWGFAPHQFSAMRSYMRRAFPGMRETAGGPPTFGGGARAQGNEPCTWDQYCEVQGAMMAWMQNRADVDANLQRYFQITRNDVNRFGLHWGTTDMAKMQEQVNRSAAHTERYLALPM